ncbi:MAG: hypothetical protein CMP39_02950 [Rickettsiales bacterium]|nr:hypothetical protein [Rickettsiales bacterium]
MFILYFLISCISISFSLILLINIRKNRSYFFFFLTAVSLSFWIISHYLPFLVKNELFWSRFQLICSSIYPVTTLLFILEYPKKILNLNTNKIIYFFVPSLISIYLATTKLYIIDVVDNKTLVPGPLYNIFLSVFLIYFAVIIGIAIYGSITFDKKVKLKLDFFYLPYQFL